MILKMGVLLLTFSMKLIGNQKRRLEKGRKEEEQAFNVCHQPII